jgi:hypothetical protein
MIRITIAAIARDDATATLREGDIRVGEALEAVTSLVLASTFRTGRFSRIGMKFVQMSDSHIVIESGRHLTEPPLDEVSAFPAGCDRFSYEFIPAYEGAETAFRQILPSEQDKNKSSLSHHEFITDAKVL